MRPDLRTSAEWRFLSAVWHADQRLAAAWWTLIGVRGALPALFAVAMGLLVGAVQAGTPLTPPLAAAGAAFLTLRAIQPLHATVGSILGAKTGAWLHDRLLDETARARQRW